MGSVVVAQPVLDALIPALRTAVAGVQFASGSGVVTLTVHEGHADQSAGKHYVVIGGNTTESPFHTLGPATGPKWGGTVEVPVRIVTQYPTTERQTWAMLAAIKAPLEGQKVLVAGFGEVLVEFGFATMLVDTINGVVTRELIAPVQMTAHQ